MSSTTDCLPTTDKLGPKLIALDAIPAQEVAEEWINKFSARVEANDVDGILGLFVDEKLVDIYWRDMLALTWDFRTFKNAARIKPFLNDRLPGAKISNIKLDLASVSLDRPAPDLAWIQGFFSFETDVGEAVGIFRLVPEPFHVDSAAGNEFYGITWRAHTIYTNLKQLKGFPEKVGPLREHAPSHGKWASKILEDPSL
jgi:hypothetical protein